MKRRLAVVRQLVFKRSKDAFGLGVIVAMTWPAHALAEAGAGQKSSDLASGILAATIGMKEGFFWIRPVARAFCKGGHDIGLEGVGELPTEDGAAEEIDNHGQIEPALGSGDVSDVADEVCPGAGVSRRWRGDWAKDARRDRLGSSWVETVFLGVPACRASASAGRCDSPSRQAQAAQLLGHARAAVRAGMAMVMDGFHRLEQLLVLLGAGARPPGRAGVASASRDAQGLTQLVQVKILPHGLNQRIPLCGSSESMLTAFFRISRWRRRYSISRWRRRISAAGSATGAPLRPFGCAETACATRPLPRALSRQFRSELAETPSSAATPFRGRPLLRRRLTAS